VHESERPDHDDGYDGPATLSLDGHDVPVRARLDARHEPVDGKLHWFGRLTLDPAVADLPPGAHAVRRVELRIAGARSEAALGDRDPWGRYRITGIGTPPYPLD
jgi:hypothetical protein